MKIDFKKFRVYSDIKKEKGVEVRNAAEQIADAILQQGKGIAAYDLAQRVYNCDADTEFSDKDAKAIKELLNTLPTMWAVALRDVISE